MEPNYSNRGYLLPPGCKDLIDALNLKALQQSPHACSKVFEYSKLSSQQLVQLVRLMDAFKKLKSPVSKFKPKPPPPPAALPPIVGQIVISAETPVSKLAALLGQTPSQIIADVTDLGFFVGVTDPLSFEIISKVARKYGFFAIRAAA